MGSRFSVDECTSADNPRVRDCCHLEGETPIEIRIAYQPPRPPPRHTHLDTGPVGMDASSARSAYDNLQDHRPGWPPYAPDRERSSLPRGTERLRLPPHAGSVSARSQPRTPASQTGGSDFDADVFAAPPDSERGSCMATPGRMQQPMALQVLQMASDDDYFPEIVRVSRQGTTTFREREGACTNRTVSPQNTARLPCEVLPSEAATLSSAAA